MAVRYLYSNLIGDEDEMPKLELEDEEKNNNPPDSARSTLQRYVCTMILRTEGDVF